MTLHQVLAHPAVTGALTGALTAAVVDFQAFRNWKSFHDAQTFAWSIALWRWLQGAVVGAVTAFGIS